MILAGGVSVAVAAGAEATTPLTILRRAAETMVVACTSLDIRSPLYLGHQGRM